MIDKELCSRCRCRPRMVGKRGCKRCLIQVRNYHRRRRKLLWMKMLCKFCKKKVPNGKPTCEDCKVINKMAVLKYKAKKKAAKVT